MHQALRLHNLRKLPYPLQSVAMAAANGSRQDLEKLEQAKNSIPAVHRLLLLPLYRIHLDPSAIPSPEDAEKLVLGGDPDIVLHGPILALTALIGVDNTLPAVLVDLWPRVWKWSQFLDIYFPLLSQNFGIMLLLLLSRFLCHPLAGALMKNTPGVLIAYTRAWKGLFLGPMHPLPEFILDALGSFMQSISDPLSALDSEALAEMIEGAGGSVDDLASLILTHIEYFAPYDSYLSLRSWLRRYLVSAVSRALHSLADDAFSETTVVMAHCIHLVGYTFIPQGGYLRFKEAVESGFLLGFVSWTIRDNSDAGFVGKMFKTTFPAFTIYHSILSPLKERLTEVREAAKEEGFINSDIYSHWWSFVRLAETRIMIMEKYDSRAVVSLQGCDNVQCLQIRERRHFRRCAVCQTFYYCSKECQTRHWKSGGHRELCKSHATRHRERPEPYSPHDKSFMRALLHADWKSSQAQLYLGQASALARFPTENIGIAFDYTGVTDNPLSFEYTILAKPQDPPTDWDLHFFGMAAVARESGGRIHLHSMYSEEGGGTRRRVIPLYSSTPRIHNALTYLADEIRRDPAQEFAASTRAIIGELSRISEQEVHIH
ncbi:hypothetical protein C8J57DRAFT_1561794 [Mycena rebaudengoi]|nr:hypothetical protein C8J57DRAFT_1561794 [Mycena rebaudengoi]